MSVCCVVNFDGSCQTEAPVGVAVAVPMKQTRGGGEVQEAMGGSGIVLLSLLGCAGGLWGSSGAAAYLEEGGEEEDGTKCRSFLSIEQSLLYLGAIGRSKRMR